MPIRIVRQVTFFIALLLAGIGIAAALFFTVMHKEGGIFDAGFRQKMELQEMKLSGEEVLKDLPSTTVTLVPNPGTFGEESPEAILYEAGRSISRASTVNNSSDIVNINFKTDIKSETLETAIVFRFNASTAVDYNDSVFDNTVLMLETLMNTELYSKIELESTPTPDGGRSIFLDTEMKPTSNSNLPSEVAGAWSQGLQPMNRFIRDDGNISSFSLKSRNINISAQFYNKETYEKALNISSSVFSTLDLIGSSEAKTVSFNLSAVSVEDSTLTVILPETVTEETLPTSSRQIQDILRRNNLFPPPWTVIVVVDSNPELTDVVFGSTVT